MSSFTEGVIFGGVFAVVCLLALIANDLDQIVKLLGG